MHARAKRGLGWLAAIGLVLSLAAPGRGEDVEQIGSLKWIPADASFYGSSLRMKEQIDIVLKSKAWAKLMSLPALQQAKQMLDVQLQSNPQAGMFLQHYNQPENKQLLGLLGAMFSEEVFVYGDSSWGSLVKALSESNSSMQFGQYSALLAGQAGDPSAQARGLLRGLSKSKDSLHLPTLVFGFKANDETAAKAQLKRLEELVKSLPLPPEHPLHKMIVAKTIGGGHFMTFQADGSMVPWDQIPVATFEEKPGEFKPLFDHLRAQKVRLALGYSHGYVFLTLGDSFEFLEKLGTGTKLSSRPEFKQVLAHADKRLTSVGYVSKEFRETAASGNMQTFTSLAEVGTQALDKLDLTADQKARITKDIAAFTEQAKAYQPKFGGAVSFAYMTDRGTEEYSYDWMTSNLDASKTLSLLDHVGGAPIFAAVGRTKSDPSNYEKFEDAIAKVYGYAVEIGLPRMPAENRAQVQMALEKLVPIVKKLSTTTKKCLLPGFADSQIGFVMDGKLEVARLHMTTPAFPKAMPFPELALLLGVSDAKLVRQAFSEYRTTLNELIAAVREINPMIPDFEIPEARSMELKSGTAYSYPMFGQLGLDPQIMPAAGLNDKVAVLAFAPDHVSRLLTATPLKVEGGPLADLKKARAAASSFNSPALIDLVAPWVEYAAKTAQESNGGQPDAQTMKGLMEQLHTVLDIMKVFKGSTSSTYFEGDAIVTHSETVVRDI
ncbi:MAG TPA: hypothetical protein VGP68_23525 [Gemmataceae bacterium]|jgi:hypothetical protein|nr:hypothetical protein [Gemmataceae bacterium]